MRLSIRPRGFVFWLSCDVLLIAACQDSVPDWSQCVEISPSKGVAPVEGTITAVYHGIRAPGPAPIKAHMREYGVGSYEIAGCNIDPRGRIWFFRGSWLDIPPFFQGDPEFNQSPSGPPVIVQFRSSDKKIPYFGGHFGVCEPNSPCVGPTEHIVFRTSRAPTAAPGGGRVELHDPVRGRLVTTVTGFNVLVEPITIVVDVRWKPGTLPGPQTRDPPDASPDAVPDASPEAALDAVFDAQ